MANQYSFWYIWHPETGLLDNTGATRAKAAESIEHYGFTDLLVNAYRGGSYSPMGGESKWVSLISWANALGVRIWGEMSGGGSGDLAGHSTVISEILQFNQRNPSQKFYGVANDIEYDVTMTERYTWFHNTYYPAIKAVNYNGDNIASQGLKIYMYDDALIGPSWITEALWRQVAGDVDNMELQAYVDEFTTDQSRAYSLVVEKADSPNGYMGTGRATIAQSMGKDFTVVQELHRYPSTYRVSANHLLGWWNQSKVDFVLDGLHAYMNSKSCYKGICLHDDTGISMRRLVNACTVVGTTLTLDIVRAPSDTTPSEDITISSPGMTSQTFSTGTIGETYIRTFTDYVAGQNITITANRVIVDGGNTYGPCSVMVFDPADWEEGEEPEPEPAVTGKEYRRTVRDEYIQAAFVGLLAQGASGAGTAAISTGNATWVLAKAGVKIWRRTIRDEYIQAALTGLLAHSYIGDVSAAAISQGDATWRAAKGI